MDVLGSVRDRDGTSVLKLTESVVSPVPTEGKDVGSPVKLSELSREIEVLGSVRVVDNNVRGSPLGVESPRVLSERSSEINGTFGKEVDGRLMLLMLKPVFSETEVLGRDKEVDGKVGEMLVLMLVGMLVKEIEGKMLVLTVVGKLVNDSVGEDMLSDVEGRVVGKDRLMVGRVRLRLNEESPTGGAGVTVVVRVHEPV